VLAYDLPWNKNKETMMKNEILITGSTGNIGGEMVLQLLRDFPQSRLYLLVRAESNSAAADRLEKHLGILSPGFNLHDHKGRIKILYGDITEKNLGLDTWDYLWLASRVTHIIHSAATTKFQVTLNYARKVNYQGTKNVLDLAIRASNRNRHPHFAYISTAYVCGEEQGMIAENDFIAPKSFSNFYEQSKWEAECEVRKHAAIFPVSIFRPSIVVGNSKSGSISSFNVLYTPIKYILKGMIGSLACSPDIPIDIVPLDYVAAAVLHIIFKSENSDGKVFHITAGANASPTAGEIIKFVRDYACKYDTSPNLGDIQFTYNLELPGKLRGHNSNSPRINEILKCYEPYLNLRRNFISENTNRALRNSGIIIPAFNDYFERLLDFCFKTEWGKSFRSAA
jgi:long-chain acyl-CoA synthetase